MFRLLVFFLAITAFAQTPYLSLREIRAGMKGTGLTVFAGEKVESFNVEILGILDNAGPKQSVILGKLSGGPLAHTGVMQGMSGSPVYINGKLIGAVALAFSLAKDPIAGIRPIEEMLEPKAVNRASAARPCTGLAVLNPESCPESQVYAALNKPASNFAWGESKLEEIATPVSFSGFTTSTLEHFGAQLKQFGLEPRQGMSGGGASRLPDGNPASLKPGSMISVMLVNGDMSVGADGTVTHIDGKNIYAFGHRFVAVGDVEMPFASSEVLTLLPNLSTSFKISTPRKMLGVITSDYSTAVRGELGRKAKTVPVSITVRHGKLESKYDVGIVRDATLTPFLLQMAAFSALDATERTVGASSINVRQQIDFNNGQVNRSSNLFSGDFNTPVLAAQSGAIPVAYVMQAALKDLEVQRVSLEFEVSQDRRQVSIEDVVPAHRTARPGESVPIQVIFASEGKRITKTAVYKIPQGAPTGTLQFTVSDGPISNILEFRQTVMTPPRSGQQVLRLINGLRENNKAYIRIWRAEPAYNSQGEDLPAPPPSVANLLARSQSSSALVNYTSKIAEIEIPMPGLMVSGSKTVSLEVKE